MASPERLAAQSGVDPNVISDDEAATGIERIRAENPALGKTLDLWAKGNILAYKVLFIVGANPVGAAAISASIAATTGVTIPPAAIQAASKLGLQGTLYVEGKYNDSKNPAPSSNANAEQGGSRRESKATATQGGVRRDTDDKPKSLSFGAKLAAFAAFAALLWGASRNSKGGA